MPVIGRGDHDRIDVFALEQLSKIAELLQNAGIVRNKLKIIAAVNNAQKFLVVQQEFGNFTDYLWGFVSNGLVLRLLRDNASLTRQAFVDFDLETIFEGEVYADFALLWLLCQCLTQAGRARLAGEARQAGSGLPYHASRASLARITR